MALDGTELFDKLDAWSAALFLGGGVLYAVLVANRILMTYTAMAVPHASTVAWLGWILVSLGLLGLYPALVDRRPYLARIAAVVAVVPGVCSAVVAAGELLDAAGILTEAPGLLGLAPFAAFVTMYLAFALFGVTVLLADVHPTAVGVLMLVSAVGFPLFMTVLSGLPSYVANGVNLVAYLGVGLLLWTDGVGPAEVDPPVDQTA